LPSEYFDLHPVNPQVRLIRRAAEIVRRGGLIAYPTDSCYALGWHLGDKDAQERVRRIRQADRHHHYTLVCGTLAEIGRQDRSLAISYFESVLTRALYISAACDAGDAAPLAA
jgi:tRNA A37 threonylcarbamoyladenosine synthetase subunit TsaC/SUA5/YrdC